MNDLEEGGPFTVTVSPAVPLSPELTLPDIESLMHRARYAKSRIDEMKDTMLRAVGLAERDIQQARDNFELQTASDRQIIAETTAQCEQFMLRRLKTLHKSDKKSVTLTHGEITSREVGPLVERFDQDVVEAWAKEHGYMRKIPAVPASEVVEWSRLRIAILAGLEVPGTTLDNRDPVVTVTIRGDQ